MRYESFIPSLMIISLIVMGGCIVLSDSFESEAATYGSASNPWTSLSGDFIDYEGDTFYIAVGSRVTITTDSDINMEVSGVTSGYGLSLNGTTVSGTISKAGTIIVTAIDVDWKERTFTIVAVETTTFVSSVSISGSSSVTVGSSITLTAKVSPTDGYFTGIWWYTSDSSVLKLGTETNTSTGGTVKVTAKKAGSAVISCEVKGDNGSTLATAQKTVTVSNPSKSITLSFSANGGSGAPSSITKSTTGSSYTFTIPTTEPTRSGYDFLGWSKSSTSSTASYSPGGSITLSSSDTLYAVWREQTTPVTSITISGSSGVTVGSSITLTATTSPTSADDRHVVWSITSGSNRVSYTTSDTSTGGKIVLTGVSAGNVTVKATAADGSGVSKTKTITVSNPSYTCYLYYNANGGSGAPSTQSYTGTSTSSHTFTISSTEPTRSGFIFLGWSTSSTASVASYDPGDSISVTYNGSKTLYAVWEEDVTYVTSITISGTSSVKVGSSVTLRATTSPSDADERGVTWSIQSGSSYVTISGSSSTTGGTCVVTGKAAGTAVIKATASDGSGISKTYTVVVSNNTYYLYYDANDGSGAPATQSYSGGTSSTHSFTVSSTVPVRDGYVFMGWNTVSDGSGTSYSSGQSVSVSKNSSVTLYAVWEESEDPLAFTTVPVQDCVVLPSIVYHDDGTYEVISS